MSLPPAFGHGVGTTETASTVLDFFYPSEAPPGGTLQVSPPLSGSSSHTTECATEFTSSESANIGFADVCDFRPKTRHGFPEYDFQQAQIGSLSIDFAPTDSCSEASRSLDFPSIPSRDNGTEKKAAPSSREHRRGQGYRKLWEQVTKVTAGKKLGDNTADFSETTVEDLHKIVTGLSPSQSAVQAVAQGLYYLDSSATAALLKELCKNGMSKRAVEIFDWLRGLDDGHELKVLCDVYTYTTMVSQCKSHQQLRRALELVAEMRSRDIDCNVRTYTALMNVCTKANEMNLALDVYHQMLKEGCIPNLVTYNTLIDIYGKTGQLSHAIDVLDTLDRQGIRAEVRTFNTVISACNRSGQPEQASAVYERMLAKDVKPSATTYTALISAYGKRGQIEKALDVFRDMLRRGCERNVITYSSLIGACEKSGQWELALDLFKKMHDENCKPNVVTYNSLIAACANGRRWRKACEVFEHMIRNGCRPDCSTYSAIISALSRGGPWVQALRLYEDMPVNCVRPDVVVFNALLETLWHSGVAAAQAKAIQLWKVAVRRNIIRFSVSNGHDTELSVVVFTCGAAIITVVHWLMDLRNQLVGGGYDGLQHQNAYFSLILQRGKHNTAAQSPSLIQSSVLSLLSSAGDSCLFNVELVDQNIHISVTAGTMSNLFHGGNTLAFASLVSMDPTSCSNQTSVLCTDEEALMDRCSKAFAAVCRYEEKHPCTLRSDLHDLRVQHVKIALIYGSDMGFKEETVHDALVLFDRVLASGMDFEPDQDHVLIILACLLLMGRLCEDRDLLPCAIALPTMASYSGHALASMEGRIRSALSDDIGAISTLRIAHLYLERLGSLNVQPQIQFGEQIMGDLRSMVTQVAQSPQFIKFYPSIVAAALLYVVRRKQGVFPYWPSALSLMTGYSPEKTESFNTCLKMLEGLGDVEGWVRSSGGHSTGDCLQGDIVSGVLTKSVRDGGP